jgi:hypothetical protein
LIPEPDHLLACRRVILVDQAADVHYRVRDPLKRAAGPADEFHALTWTVEVLMRVFISFAALAER